MTTTGKKKTMNREGEGGGEHGGEMEGTEVRMQGTRPQKLLDWRSRWRARFQESKGMLLVLASEFFATCMAAAARLLETGDGGGMGTLQIMFVRFSITFTLSTLYMWYTAVPDFPFGKPEVRWLLVLRGCGGFVGIFGFYYSVQYLPVAEAILIGFIIPIFTAYLTSIFLHVPFDKKQLLAGLISFLGVVLIAQPFSLPRSLEESSPAAPGTENVENKLEPSAIQRVTAVLLGVLGAFGAGVAYTTIRVIGQRAHPLLSVNYFASIVTLLSGFILLLPVFPVSFELPSGVYEWGLLVGIGVSGFLLQFLMTMGLLADKSSRATNMMYSSVVFALVLDWVIWGKVMRWSSWVGGAVVVAATVWGAMQKTADAKGERTEDEEYAMVATGDDLDELVDGESDEAESGSENENGTESEGRIEV